MFLDLYFSMMLIHSSELMNDSSSEESLESFCANLIQNEDLSMRDCLYRAYQLGMDQYHADQDQTMPLPDLLWHYPKEKQIKSNVILDKAMKRSYVFIIPTFPIVVLSEFMRKSTLSFFKLRRFMIKCGMCGCFNIGKIDKSDTESEQILNHARLFYQMVFTIPKGIFKSDLFVHEEEFCSKCTRHLTLDTLESDEGPLAMICSVCKFKTDMQEILFVTQIEKISIFCIRCFNFKYMNFNKVSLGEIPTEGDINTTIISDEEQKNIYHLPKVKYMRSATEWSQLLSQLNSYKEMWEDYPKMARVEKGKIVFKYMETACENSRAKFQKPCQN